MKKELRALIFNIQRYSIHDGNGIRTIVFFKGCPLKCPWCANPESQMATRQIMYYQNRCASCLRCVEHCPIHAIKPSETGILLDYDACKVCGTCASSCLSNSLEVVGRTIGLDELLDIVERDRIFYDGSDGGVTLSGGEPLMQPEFAAAFAKACKWRGLRTAMETSGFQTWDRAWPVFENIDQILLDIKMVDEDKHLKVVGVPNDVIKRSAEELVRRGKDITIRVPVIPGFNNDPEEIIQIAQFAERIGVEKIHLLPYHRLGTGKYAQIGKTYTLSDIMPPSQEEMAGLCHVVSQFGIKCQIGG